MSEDDDADDGEDENNEADSGKEAKPAENETRKEDKTLTDDAKTDKKTKKVSLIHLSRIAREPVFAISDQPRHKPGGTITEDC